MACSLLTNSVAKSTTGPAAIATSAGRNFPGRIIIVLARVGRERSNTRNQSRAVAATTRIISMRRAFPVIGPKAIKARARHVPPTAIEGPHYRPPRVERLKPTTPSRAVPSGLSRVPCLDHWVSLSASQLAPGLAIDKTPIRTGGGSALADAGRVATSNLMKNGVSR